MQRTDPMRTPDGHREPDPDFSLEPWIPMVDALVSVLGPGNEVVLHDLRAIPNSIVAIAGDLTGRSVGGPMTDLLLGLLRRGDNQDLINYETTHPDGRLLRCSTTFIRDGNGTPVGCLCFNHDLSPWEYLRGLAERQLATATGLVPLPNQSGGPRPAPAAAELPVPAEDLSDGLQPSAETFPPDVDTLQRLLVDRAIRESGVPVTLMKKGHKTDVVHALDEAGYFLIRDAVEYLAQALHVTRYTIYNYLNEVRAPSAASGDPAGRRS